MTEFRYDTYCGLYCGACDIMRACREGGETGRPPQWADLPARFTGHLPHAEIKCHGCKSDDVFAGCNGCPIRRCARKKGNVATCLECAKYPCMIWRLFRLVARLRKLDRKLPDWKIAQRNLRRMQDAGIPRWLEEQQAVWQCPDCGTPFAWYRERCAKCGRDVESLKDYNIIDPAA